MVQCQIGNTTQEDQSALCWLKKNPTIPFPLFVASQVHITLIIRHFMNKKFHITDLCLWGITEIFSES